ncbi:hypothetical protein B0H10DRAFT_1995363 [Mycena sp. CBHHK59/15]|nr:hypothetical protein B0H10DRAFT_1995363 [Mycena sp. CBHHK59/15]
MSTNTDVRIVSGIGHHATLCLCVLVALTSDSALTRCLSWVFGIWYTFFLWKKHLLVVSYARISSKFARDCLLMITKFQRPFPDPAANDPTQ